jgi:hypothetical protein
MAAPLDAQFFLRYDRRTRKSFLSIRIGYPGPHDYYPWCGARHAAWGYGPPIAYTTGTIVYLPAGGLLPVMPTPWNPPRPRTEAPPSTPLLARYTRYVGPPAPTGPALDVRVQALIEAGLARLKDGQPQAAATAFREAILLSADNATLELYFGLALAAVGDWVHADKALASAVNLGAVPGNVKELFSGDEAFAKMLAAADKKGGLTAAVLNFADAVKAKTILDGILNDEPGDAAAKKLRALLPE